MTPNTELEAELALALEVASIVNSNSSLPAWSIESPFQAIVNRLLARAGREPVALGKQKKDAESDVRP